MIKFKERELEEYGDGSFSFTPTSHDNGSASNRRLAAALAPEAESCVRESALKELSWQAESIQDQLAKIEGRKYQVKNE